MCVKNSSEDLIYKHGAIKHEAGKFLLISQRRDFVFLVGLYSMEWSFEVN